MMLTRLGLTAPLSERPFAHACERLLRLLKKQVNGGRSAVYACAEYWDSDWSLPDRASHKLRLLQVTLRRPLHAGKESEPQEHHTAFDVNMTEKPGPTIVPRHCFVQAVCVIGGGT